MLNPRINQPSAKPCKKRKRMVLSQAKSDEYYQALKQNFLENTRIRPDYEWADGYEMPSEEATEVSLNGLTPQEIKTLYSALDGLELSDINEQLIIKKAIVNEIAFWKEEIKRLIDEKHEVFKDKAQLWTNLGFINSFLFLLLVQAGCVKRADEKDPDVSRRAIEKRFKKLAENQEDEPEEDSETTKKSTAKPVLVEKNIPFLVETIQAIHDFDGSIECSTTQAGKHIKKYFPGGYYSKAPMLRFRDWAKSQGFFYFERMPMILSTTLNIHPFTPLTYSHIDIPKIFTFAMALEQVLLEQERDRIEEKQNLQVKHATKDAFSSALPAHKVNFLRLAFNSLFDGIAQWNRAGESHGTQGWLPTIFTGLSEIEELVWAKFCRTLRWVTGFKPKIAQETT